MKHERKIMLRLSASRKKTYEQCPRKYYYNYMERLPRKQWDHFDLGTLAHGALEIFHADYLNDSCPPNKPKRLMKQAFKQQRKIMEQDRPLAETILFEARDLLMDYLKKIEENGIGSEILFIEEAFDIPLNEKYNALGIIDRLDRDPDGIYHIKDYKTSKNPKYLDPDQLKIYGIYLLDKYPETDMFRGSYIMLRHGSMPISYTFNKEDVEKERKSMIECADKISEEERWITRPSKLCNWCDFQGPCFNTW